MPTREPPATPITLGDWLNTPDDYSLTLSQVLSRRMSNIQIQCVSTTDDALRFTTLPTGELKISFIEDGQIERTAILPRGSMMEVHNAIGL